MALIELDSFVTKLKYLCSVGLRATLTVEADNGEASVVLKASLGVIQPPDNTRHQGAYFCHRGPAYQCCQEALISKIELYHWVRFP